MTIGERIRLLRRERGYTQEEVASAIGTSKQTIFKYEKNAISNIPLEKIKLIASVLAVTPAQLMGWEEPEGIETDGMDDPKRIAHQLLDEVPADKLRDVMLYMRFLRESEEME